MLTDTTTGKSQNWHFPSFGQCWECHRNGWGTLETGPRNDKYRVLGFTARQLGVEQRAALVAKGVFEEAIVAAMPAPMPSPNDDKASLEQRAHAYLAANCSPCHHENVGYTGGGQTWIASYDGGDLTARHLAQPANNYPMTLRLGLPDGKLIAPGDAAHSVLLARIRSNDPDLRMPPLARNVVDGEGAAVVEAWINSLAP